MNKTYTLAEILTDHMDAVQEGRVRTKGGGYLRMLDGLGVIGWTVVRPPAFRASDTQAPPIDGYTVEPKKVQVPTELPTLTSHRGLRSDSMIVEIKTYEALLRIARAAKAWLDLGKNDCLDQRARELREATDAVELEDGDA